MVEHKHYFCNDCGTKFVSGRDDPPCPECGSWDTYPDTEQGHDAAIEAFQRYEAELWAWSRKT